MRFVLLVWFWLTRFDVPGRAPAQKTLIHLGTGESDVGELRIFIRACPD